MSGASGGAGGVARRLRTARWHDPRLLLGVLLVLTSTALGARLLATGDDTSGFWAVDSAVVEGDPVSADDLRVVDVRLPRGTADRYLEADDELPADLEDLVWARGADGGTLVEPAHLTTADADVAGELPIGVTVGSFPSDLRRGDRVDVWSGPAPGSGSVGPAVRVLAAARVLDAGEPSSAIGGELTRTLLVEAGPDDLDGGALGTLSAGHVTVVRVR